MQATWGRLWDVFAVAALLMLAAGYGAAGIMGQVDSNAPGTRPAGESPVQSTGQVDAAYAFLAQQMDQFHTCFYVYDDRDSGAVNFVPDGWMGDLEDVPPQVARGILDDACTENPYRGGTCIKLSYPKDLGTQNWVGIYWQFPARNWGKKPGYDLSRYTGDGRKKVRVTFFARAAEEGVRGEFKVGGIEGQHPDTFGPVSTGVITLGKAWKQHTIDLSGQNLKNVTGGFCWATNRPQNPRGCVLYLDEIRFELGPQGIASRLAEPRFIRSYVPQGTGEPDRYFRNACYIYDNALALSALVARGNADDLRRAKLLADAFVYAQAHDRHFTDGRLRNAYACGDLADRSNLGAARLPGWWDDTAKSWFEDKYFAGSDCGNLAWVMIGLLNYWEKADQRPGSPYLKSACELGRWIGKNASSLGDPGGFTGGMEGWEKTLQNPAGQQPATWKSTEHNIDLFVAFSRLHRATRDPAWLEHAEHARGFVERMWSAADNHLWTGTGADGRTIERSNIPVDIQVWALLAFRDAKRYAVAIDWAEKNALVAKCPRGCHAGGFDFNTDRDGVWWEGTSQMQMAFRMLGNQAQGQRFLKVLHAAAAGAKPGGAMPAACHDGVSTGFTKEWGNWVYYHRPHLGATCWYIFADLGWNPYWREPIQASRQ